MRKFFASAKLATAVDRRYRRKVLKRLLPFIIVALVFAATLTAGGLLLRAKKSAEAEKVAAIAKQSKGKPGAEPPHVRGTGKPAVVLEEFADFECPPCGNM